MNSGIHKACQHADLGDTRHVNMLTLVTGLNLQLRLFWSESMHRYWGIFVFSPITLVSLDFYFFVEEEVVF